MSRGARGSSSSSSGAKSSGSSANRHVYQSLDVGYHPFQNNQNIQPNADVLELFVPSSYFVDSPRGWNSLLSSDASLRHAYLCIVTLFNYIGEEAGPYTTPTDLNGVTRFIPDVVASFETVPFCPARTKPAGYRYRVAVQRVKEGKLIDSGSILADLFEVNDKQAEAKRKKRTRQQAHEPESEARQFINSVTLEQYTRLCGIYTGMPYDMDQVRAYPLSDKRNPVAPGNVFRIEESCRLAAAAEADPNYCEWTNYKSLDCNYKYPFPDHVWRVRQSYLKPENTLSVFWPCVQPGSHDATDPRRVLYIRTHAVGGITEEQAAFAYDQNVVRSSAVDEAPDSFDTLKEKHRRKIDKINSAFNAGRMSQQQRDDARDVADEETLHDFAALFSPQASQRAIASISQWMNDFARTHGTFCMPIPKMTNNLTRFGDEMVQTMSSLECLGDIISEHRNVFSLILKNMHVYSARPFNINTTMGGPPSAGKSYMALFMMKMLIPGTFLNSTYQTAKALAVPGDAEQFMLRVFEDVVPSMLGINTNGKASDTSNQDQESLLKAWLTSGVINAAVFNCPDGDRMEAKTAHVHAKVNTSCTFITNAALPTIPHSVLDRTHPMQQQLKERVDGCNPLVKATKKSSNAQIEGLELLTLRFRRNQAFIAIIFLLIHVGYFDEIDMTAATIITSKTLELAKTRGVPKVSSVRNKERVDMLTRVLVIWDAISILWDSPHSPFAGCPHDITHFSLVKRYLRATVEHPTFALGLLSDQYESRISISVIDNLRNTIFRSITKKRRGGSNTTTTGAAASVDAGDNAIGADSHKGMVHEDANYFIAPWDDSQMGRSGRSCDDMDRIRHLARIQLATMSEKPMEADLIHAYEQLLWSSVADVTHKPKSEFEQQRQKKALVFESGNIKLAKKALFEAKPNALLACMQRILDHECAEPCTYVYGVTLPHCPFLWEYIKVGDGKGKKLRLVNDEPTYMDPVVASITQNFLQGIHNLKSASSGEPLSVFNVRAGAAELPRVIIDFDLNVLADRAFFEHAKFGPGDVEGLPEGNPIKLGRQLVEWARENDMPLIDYPTGIPQYHQINYVRAINEALAANPDKYKMSRLLSMSAPPALEHSVLHDTNGVHPSQDTGGLCSLYQEKEGFVEGGMQIEC